MSDVIFILIIYWILLSSRLNTVSIDISCQWCYSLCPCQAWSISRHLSSSNALYIVYFKARGDIAPIIFIRLSISPAKRPLWRIEYDIYKPLNHSSADMLYIARVNKSSPAFGDFATMPISKALGHPRPTLKPETWAHFASRHLHIMAASGASISMPACFAAWAWCRSHVHLFAKESNMSWPREIAITLAEFTI